MLDAVDKFLTKFCVRPEILRAAINNSGHRWLAEKAPGERICEQGQPADCCWLVLKGEVDIFGDDQFIKTRHSGELIGEQAFLLAMRSQGRGLRTATMIARGNVCLLSLNKAFIDQLSPEERAEWFQTLAIVESSKLDEATRERSVLQSTVSDKMRIIRRFADEESVVVVNDAISSASRVVKRNAIVYFSDLAGFSRWAENKNEEDVANTIRTLIGVQIDVIRNAGGLIDKLMGDGLMAFWFIDSSVDQAEVPERVLLCAKSAIEGVRRILDEGGLSSELDIRVGLHKGPVAYGDFGTSGRISVTLLGRTVNVAARYEQARSNDVALGRLRFSPELNEMIGAENIGRHLKVSGPHKVIVKNTEIDLLSLEV